MTWTVPVEPELGIGHGARLSIQGGDTVRNALIVDLLKPGKLG